MPSLPSATGAEDTRAQLAHACCGCHHTRNLALSAVDEYAARTTFMSLSGGPGPSTKGFTTRQDTEPTRRIGAPGCLPPELLPRHEGPLGLRHNGEMSVMVLQKLSSPSANTWETWAPVASLVIAAFSLLAAIANRKTAKKALKLSEIQEERRAARLDVSLMEAVSWRPNNETWRLIGMRILAVNPTNGMALSSQRS